MTTRKNNHKRNRNNSDRLKLENIAMSNDERVEELKKRIDITLPHSNTLPAKKAAKPNTEKLKELAKEIRKNLEDYTIDAATYTDHSYRLK